MKANQKLTNVLQGKSVEEVLQEDANLILSFSDGSTLRVKLAEETSSVMVRDGENNLEYAD